MSELTTQESTDDLEPISESPSKTLDEGQEESSSENDETLEEDDDDLKQNNAKNNEQTLDCANANNVQFDNENNIPVSFFYTTVTISSHCTSFSAIQTI